MLEGFLSADLGDGGGGGSSSGGPTSAVSTGAPSGAATPDAGAAVNPSAAPAPSQPQQPQQPQGPDWGSLGVPFDQAKQRLEYYQQLEQRYADPAWAQKYDGLFKEQQQPQAHPYDWMTADEKRAEALRQQGDQHPDFPRLQAEFTNFFQNPIGQLAQYATHPKVVEALLPALMPQIQDMAQRIAQQHVQPVQQFVQHYGEQQFRAQYEKPWTALPDSIKQMAQEGIFGDWNQNRQQAIIAAVKAGQRLAAQQQPPTAEGAQPPADKPKPGAPAPKAATNASNARTSKAAEEFERDYTKAWGR